MSRKNGELWVCALFNDLTGKTFLKTRSLPWLKPLELDGYNEELRLAFEFQGQQHFKVVKHWHPKGIADLQAQQDRDAKKARLCAENGVRLCVVRYDDDFELTVRRFLGKMEKPTKFFLPIAVGFHGPMQQCFLMTVSSRPQLLNGWNGVAALTISKKDLFDAYRRFSSLKYKYYGGCDANIKEYFDRYLTPNGDYKLPPCREL